MGEVFLAEDADSGRQVAIKQLRRDAAESTADAARLRREARAAAQVSHPAMVGVHEVFEDETGFHVVMEYVAGETVAAHLARGALAPETAIALAQEIAEGLAAAHAENLVHRDLKAENVIITPEGHAKILDFGLARSLSLDADDPVTETGRVIGTCRSMAPECLTDASCLEPRADLFSLGVLLYEMVTAVSPFRGDHPLDTVHKVFCFHPPPVHTLRPEVPPGLSRLIERLIEKHPDDRPPSATWTAKALADLLDPGRSAPFDGDETLDLTDFVPPSLRPPAEAPAPASGRRWLLLGASLFLALVAAGLLVVLL